MKMDETLYKIEKLNFLIWLAESMKSDPSGYFVLKESLDKVNAMLFQKHIVSKPFTVITDRKQIETIIKKTKQTYGNILLRRLAIRLLNKYLAYRKEQPQLESIKKPKNPIPDNWIKYDFTNSQAFQETYPVKCSFNGKQIEGNNWARILVGIVENEISKKNPALNDLKENSLLKTKKDRPFFINDKLVGLNCAALSNGYWLNVNYSIPRLLDFIYAFCSHCGYTKEQIVLYGIPKETDKKEKGVEHKLVVDSELQKKVERLLLDADLEGMTLETLSDKIPSASMKSLKDIRDSSDKIIVICDYMLHKDALVDLDEAAAKFHDIIELLLTKNDGYVSSAQLFEYARVKMQMFLNDNDIFDEQKIFCIVKFLFDKIGWHEYRYAFSSGRHISRCGSETITSNMDVFKRFARGQGGVFLWSDLLKYLDKVGIKPNNLRVQMEIGTKPIFFYLSSDILITAESMQIDNEWMGKTKSALNKLFNDVGDHIVIRDIDSYWYEQLPELPRRIRWTPVLLQYIINFYGDNLNARTIHTEMTQQYDQKHALLVRKDCEIHTFGDAIIAYIIDNNILERSFQAEQLRHILANGKLIGEFELIGNLPRAIGNDPRFAWDVAGEYVTIRV